MAPTFSDSLQEASLDGVAFPVVAAPAHGSNSYGRARYPYRAGQDAEHTGREPYRFDLEIPLFNGVEWPDELWPAKWDALRGVLEDPERRGLHEYVDPEFGPIPVIAVDWTRELRAEPRDGVMVRLTLEERQLDVGTFAIRPDTDPAGTSERLAGDLDAAAAAAGLSDEDLATALDVYGVPLTDGDAVTLGEGNVLASLVGDFTGALDEGLLAQDDLAATLDSLRSRIDAVRSLPETQDPRNWSLLYTSERLIASVTDMAEVAGRTAPAVIDYLCRDEVSVYEIAAELYRDATRVDGILSRNRIRNALAIPRGTVLRVLAPDGW